jgi:sulfate adenylyltransferase subunit 2
MIEAPKMRSYQRSQLAALEDEAVHIMREIAAERERPVLLFSGGKDSIVLLRLAEKAFRPARFPVPADARRHRAQLPRDHRVPRQAGGRARRAPHRRQRQESIDRAASTEEKGPRASRNRCRP